MSGHEQFNEGIYSHEKVASEWIAWIESIPTENRDEVREQEIYPWLSKWIKELQPQTVLEIGSGQGVCSERVSLGNAAYVGVEPSAHLRRRAKELYPQQDFRAGCAENLPFPNESFDAAFSTFVWFHIFDIGLAAKELARVLKPDGSFAIITANPDMYELWKSWHKNPQVSGKELRGDMERLSGDVMYMHSEKEIIDSLAKYHLRVTDRSEFGYENAQEKRGAGFTVIFSGQKLMD